MIRNTDHFRVQRVSAEATWQLRHEVLRPGLRLESARFDGDDDPAAGHFAIREITHESSGRWAAVGTIFPDRPPWDESAENAWRIRGMATSEELRGRGLGTKVLGALLDHAIARGASLVWCNARQGAFEFYRRAGFVPFGDVFDDGIAIHQVMWRSLERS